MRPLFCYFVLAVAAAAASVRSSASSCSENSCPDYDNYEMLTAAAQSRKLRAIEETLQEGGEKPEDSSSASLADALDDALISFRRVARAAFDDPHFSAAVNSLLGSLSSLAVPAAELVSELLSSELNGSELLGGKFMGEEMLPMLPSNSRPGAPRCCDECRPGHMSCLAACDRQCRSVETCSRAGEGAAAAICYASARLSSEAMAAERLPSRREEEGSTSACRAACRETAEKTACAVGGCAELYGATAAVCRELAAFYCGN